MADRTIHRLTIGAVEIEAVVRGHGSRVVFYYYEHGRLLFYCDRDHAKVFADFVRATEALGANG